MKHYPIWTIGCQMNEADSGSRGRGVGRKDHAITLLIGSLLGPNYILTKPIYPSSASHPFPRRPAPTVALLRRPCRSQARYGRSIVLNTCVVRQSAEDRAADYRSSKAGNSSLTTAHAAGQITASSQH
jgi:hypothetical protein